MKITCTPQNIEKYLAGSYLSCNLIARKIAIRLKIYARIINIFLDF